MKKQGAGGAIINVTSIAARHGGGPGAVLYASAKGFVSTMTRGHAKELVKDKIRVNAVAPGVIMTPFHERFSTPQMLEGFKATIPMNRLGTAGRMRRCLPVPGFRADVGIHDRADPGSQRRSVHALNRGARHEVPEESE